jgi:hypothetical protein
MNVVELSPRMSPASYLVDNTAIVKMMKAGVGVGLQSTLKVLQMLARMLALAISRVGKPHCRWTLEPSRPIVTHIGPEPSRPGLPVAGRQYRYRRIVGMNLFSQQNMVA